MSKYIKELITISKTVGPIDRTYLRRCGEMAQIELAEAGQNPLQPVVLQGPVDKGQGGLAPQKFTQEQENAIFSTVQWAFKTDLVQKIIKRDEFFKVLYDELNW